MAICETPRPFLNRALILAALLSSAGSEATHAQEASVAAEPRASWTVPADDAIRKLIVDRMRDNGMALVVGVIEPAGRRIIAHGRFAANDPRRPDGDTVFQIGSLTKAFTTLLLADMVERGELQLNDPASKHAPAGFKIPERGRPITLGDLATHMSGLPSMPTNYVLTADPDPYEAYTVDQLREFLATYELTREPGSKFGYSNLGVSLLGRLLAHRAGMEYEALLRQRVLEPLRLSSTSVSLSADQVRRLAPGHDRDLRPVRTWEMLSLPASGSLRSTANDLSAFVAAYLGHMDTPLKAAMTRQLSVRVPVSTGTQMLGWGTRKVGSLEITGHDGGKQGYRAGAVFDPQSGIGIVVLSNARTDDAPINLAVHLLTGRPLPPAPTAPLRGIVDLEPEAMERYAGDYRMDPTDVLTIAAKGHRLLMHVPGSGVVELYPSGERDFFLNTGNDELTFELDDRGAVTGLVLYGNGRDGGAGRRAARASTSASLHRH